MFRCTSRSQYPAGNRSAKLVCRGTAINEWVSLKLVLVSHKIAAIYPDDLFPCALNSMCGSFRCY